MQVGCRFLVSKPVTPNPNRILYLSDEVLRFFDQIRRDLVVIWRNLGQISTDSARSRQIRPDFYPISTDPAIFRPDIAGSGQISAKSRRIRPGFVPGDKPETDPNQPETDETQTEKSNQISGSVLGQFFIHPPHSGRVRVGHKPDPARPVDTPSH